MHVGRVERIADAVLYEGHVLWPYRQQQLLQRNGRARRCGTVYPERHNAAHPHHACVMQTQCLALATPDAALSVRVRFLHQVHRAVARLTEDGREPVDELTVGGERYVSWDEATEREILVPQLRFGGHSFERTDIHIPAGEEREVLQDGLAQPVGLLTRSWCTLAGSVDVHSEPLGSDLFRVTVRIANRSALAGDEQEGALQWAFCSTHTILRVEGGELVSLSSPPAELREEAERCENTGTWPVLAGEPGDRQTVLSAPIVLPDHPALAREDGQDDLLEALQAL
jgi:hypothetical protein